MKLKVTKKMLEKKPYSIVAKGVIGNKKIVAVLGAIGDWAAYYVEDMSWSWDEIADLGYKIYKDNIGRYFDVSKEVKMRYRR